ncbi:MAG: methionyl-tRNA formyltransferase [Candidatus Omnitrophica bacterium]|nr:methionyl-tRNA formyltransferase [Candidatus Omnitrophota bacterium]
MAQTDLKSVALQAKLNIFQPLDVNGPESVKYLKSFQPDLFVIAAYGQILSQGILDIPNIFPLNIHASLLPRYRGAAPINWAIVRGDKITGVSIMRLIRKMDAGPVLAQRKIEINERDDSITLEDKLRSAGAELLLDSIKSVEDKTFKLIPQDEKKVILAPKLKKKDGQIDWNKPAEEIHNLVRGVLPWPGAFTYYKGKLLKVYKAKIISCQVLRSASSQAGQILNVSKQGIVVACSRDSLCVEELQLEGKRRMSPAEFISGHKISPKEIFNKK